MRISNAILILTVFSSALALGAAQQTAAPTPVATTAGGASTPTPLGTAPATPAPAVPAASSILQPSLDSVRQTLTGLKVERWKRGSVRDEANTDISSLQSDLQQRMPALLKDADAAPGTLSKALPVSRHLDALYDVLLRVVEAARMSAPDDQANQLRNALSELEKARLVLDDSMENAAGSQEKQLVDLRVTVQKQAAFKCPAPPPPPVCAAPAVKRPLRKKPATVPGTGTPQSAPQKAPATGTTPQKTAATSANGTTQQKPAAKPSATTPQKPATPQQ